MVIDVSKLPRFIDKTTDCNFCGKDAPIDDVVIENDNLLRMTYICRSLNCDSMKWLFRPAIQEIQIDSLKLVSLYKKHQENATL
jgi:hypothetical protein